MSTVYKVNKRWLGLPFLFLKGGGGGSRIRPNVRPASWVKRLDPNPPRIRTSQCIDSKINKILCIGTSYAPEPLIITKPGYHQLNISWTYTEHGEDIEVIIIVTYPGAWKGWPHSPKVRYTDESVTFHKDTPITIVETFPLTLNRDSLIRIINISNTQSWTNFTLHILIHVSRVKPHTVFN